MVVPSPIRHLVAFRSINNFIALPKSRNNFNVNSARKPTIRWALWRCTSVLIRCLANARSVAKHFLGHGSSKDMFVRIRERNHFNVKSVVEPLPIDRISVHTCKLIRMWRNTGAPSVQKLSHECHYSTNIRKTVYNNHTRRQRRPRLRMMTVPARARLFLLHFRCSFSRSLSLFQVFGKYFVLLLLLPLLLLLCVRVCVSFPIQLFVVFSIVVYLFD